MMTWYKKFLVTMEGEFLRLLAVFFATDVVCAVSDIFSFFVSFLLSFAALFFAPVFSVHISCGRFN